MKVNKYQFLIALIILNLILNKVMALQKHGSNTVAAAPYHYTDSISKNGYTLIFINRDSVFAKLGTAVKQRMEDTFFDVYPKEAAYFNNKTLRTVTFIIDPEYDGVAATDNGVVHYNPQWMLKQPTDIDVVTHEVMHIVQDYGNTNGPGWLTEGIADYARYKFGVDNAGAKWALPAFNASQHYDNSYRITARFLAWIEKNVKQGFVKHMDAQMRAHTYNPGDWKKLTGKTLDELWSAYAANPASV